MSVYRGGPRGESGRGGAFYGPDLARFVLSRHSLSMGERLIETKDGVTLEPPVPATGLVVWLHGLGADGHDFVPFVRELGLTDRGLRVVLPHAPARPIQAYRGYVMRAWCDVLHTDFGRDQDERGIDESVARVTALLQAETARGIPPQRVVIAGFSQGGVVALETGLRYPERLAGLIALSTYLALPDRLEAEASPANRGLPVFVGHGDQDPVIPVGLGDESARVLTGAGYQVEYCRYPMAHSVSPEEGADIDRWLRNHLG